MFQLVGSVEKFSKSYKTFLIQPYVNTEVDWSTYSAPCVSLAQSSGQQKRRQSEEMSLLTAALCWLIKIQDKDDNNETKIEEIYRNIYVEYDENKTNAAHCLRKE